MRVTGFAVLILGLGIGAHLYYPELRQHDAAAREAAGRLFASSVPDPQPLPASTTTAASRTFSPQNPLFGTAPAQHAEAAPRALPVKPVDATEPVAVKPPAVVGTANGADERPANAWAATVQVLPGGEVSAPKPVSSRPRGEEAKVQLIRDLQTELKRVGCYEGDIDGSWGPGSKRAMSAFTDRVNATLPVDEPDFILLTLLQGHRVTACGKSCPKGQALSGERCLPNSVVARAERRRAPASVAARNEQNTSHEANTATASKVAPAAVDTATRERSPESQIAAVPPRARSVDLQEGRMSIGGPPVAVRGAESIAVPATPTPAPERIRKATHSQQGLTVARAEAPESETLSPPSSNREKPSSANAQRATRNASTDRSNTSAPLQTGGREVVRQENVNGGDKRVHRERAPKIDSRARHEPAPRRVAEHRMVRHAPAPHYAPRPSQPTFKSRSQRMVFDLFQRPDRVY